MSSVIDLIGESRRSIFFEKLGAETIELIGVFRDITKLGNVPYVKIFGREIPRTWLVESPVCRRFAITSVTHHYFKIHQYEAVDKNKLIDYITLQIDKFEHGWYTSPLRFVKSVEVTDEKSKQIIRKYRLLYYGRVRALKQTIEKVINQLIKSGILSESADGKVRLEVTSHEDLLMTYFRRYGAEVFGHSVSGLKEIILYTVISTWGFQTRDALISKIGRNVMLEFDQERKIVIKGNEIDHLLDPLVRSNVLIAYNYSGTIWYIPNSLKYIFPFTIKMYELGYPIDLISKIVNIFNTLNVVPLSYVKVLVDVMVPDVVKRKQVHTFIEELLTKPLVEEGYYAQRGNLLIKTDVYKAIEEELNKPVLVDLLYQIFDYPHYITDIENYVNSLTKAVIGICELAKEGMDISYLVNKIADEKDKQTRMLVLWLLHTMISRGIIKEEDGIIKHVDHDVLNGLLKIWSQLYAKYVK